MPVLSSKEEVFMHEQGSQGCRRRSEIHCWFESKDILEANLIVLSLSKGLNNNTEGVFKQELIKHL